MRALHYSVLQQQGSAKDIISTTFLLPILMFLLFIAVGHQIARKLHSKAKHWHWRVTTRRNDSIWQV